MVLALAGLAGAESGCSNAASIPDFGPPDLEQIIVFYPVGGLVRGRGLAGAAPDGASHIFIKSHPNGSETIRTLDLNGEFEFTILARGGNVLEISGATDRSGSVRGEPAFLKVPTGTFSNRDFVCCFEGAQSQGTCQTTDERDAQLQRTDGGFDCPDPLTGRAPCTSDVECGFEEGEWLEIDFDRLTVTKPNAEGFISVAGTVTPRTLVSLQNRGLSGIGQPQEQITLGQVAGNRGEFTFPSLRARGDDELILQVLDLNGIRSPAVSLRVEDADLAGFDITGAFAYRPLTDGETGIVAVLVAPFGIDGRGLCPDNDETPQTCFSGGLTHDMVSLENLRVDGLGAADGVTWAPSEPSLDLPSNRGRDGDVRAGPLDVVLVVDVSAAADSANLLQNPEAQLAVSGFIGGLRERDRIGVVTFGGDVTRLGVDDSPSANPNSSGLFQGGPSRGDVVDRLQSAMNLPGSGSSILFSGIREAAEMLRGSANAGRIVVLTAAEHAGSVDESALAFFEALDAIDASNRAGGPETRVDIIGITLTRTEKFQDIQSMTAFTAGEFFDLAAIQSGQINQLELILSDIRSTLSGSFMLLYDIMIPDGVGKAAQLEFDARMNGLDTTVQYSGPLRVDLAAN